MGRPWRSSACAHWLTRPGTTQGLSTCWSIRAVAERARSSGTRGFDLVARLHSPERAREVRRYIQYDPEPPVW